MIALVGPYSPVWKRPPPTAPRTPPQHFTHLADGISVPDWLVDSFSLMVGGLFCRRRLKRWWIPGQLSLYVASCLSFLPSHAFGLRLDWAVYSCFSCCSSVLVLCLLHIYYSFVITTHQACLKRRKAAIYAVFASVQMTEFSFSSVVVGNTGWDFITSPGNGILTGLRSLSAFWQYQHSICATACLCCQNRLC